MLCAAQSCSARVYAAVEAGRRSRGHHNGGFKLQACNSAWIWKQTLDLEKKIGSRCSKLGKSITVTTSLTISRNHKLIYDIGFHSGEDSLYFLKRGYDVVAVDANPSLIEDGLSRPVMQLARLSGQFHALARGIAGRAAQENQTLTFYVHRRVTEWSTFVPPSGRREDFSAITVPITTCGDLIHQFGTPYYMKVLRSASTPSPLLRRCRVPLTHGNT